MPKVYALHMLELSDAILTNSSSESVNDPEALFFLKLAEKKFNEFLDKDYLKDM